MSRIRYRRKADTHLPEPKDYTGSEKLNKVFLNRKGRDAMSVLTILYEKYDIGGPVPYLTIRAAEPGRAAMIIVGNTWKGLEKSTGVSAEDLTEAQAKSHPTARAEFNKHAEEKLLRLQARHAPLTIRYSTILLWWLLGRNARFKMESQKDDDRDGMHVEALIEWAEERTLGDHDCEKTGDAFKDWFRQRLKYDGAPIVGDWPQGGQDGTIQKYHSAFGMALNGFVAEYGVAVRVDFKRTVGKVDHEQRLATGLTWTDIVKIVFFCLGYIWNLDGFAWEWAEKNGTPQQRLIRLTGKALTDHCAFYLPVLRVTIIYALTGTRLGRISKLGWEKDDWRGWIDFGRRMIIRKGRLAKDPPHKPARPSLLLPLAIRVFRRWFKDDAAQRMREKWDDAESGGFFVVHDGSGNEVGNIDRRAKKAFEAVGIANRRHDLKALCVGIMWEAGFDLRRIARRTGNDPGTVEENYLFLVEESEGVERPKVDENALTFLRFMDPKKQCRHVPRASQPGLPQNPKAEQDENE
jgi:hypothetical protein